MKVRVKFFAAPREALNQSELEQDIAAGATVGELLTRLGEQHPVLRAYIHSIKVAVNHQYATLKTELHEGDEVACLPPVGGG